ncbi:MAG: hypothetical protein Q8934_21750 [Bacillota bacterium]|nr:hypothetical protein [Bacillota bacterium]
MINKKINSLKVYNDIGTAQLFEENNITLATAMGEQGIRIQVNGVNVELLTSDWNVVDDHLKKNTKFILKVNNKIASDSVDYFYFPVGRKCASNKSF